MESYNFQHDSEIFVPSFCMIIDIMRILKEMSEKRIFQLRKPI